MKIKNYWLTILMLNLGCQPASYPQKTNAGYPTIHTQHTTSQQQIQLSQAQFIRDLTLSAQEAKKLTQILKEIQVLKQLTLTASHIPTNPTNSTQFHHDRLLQDLTTIEKGIQDYLNNTIPSGNNHLIGQYQYD